jgi:hypothetical protein
VKVTIAVLVMLVPFAVTFTVDVPAVVCAGCVAVKLPPPLSVTVSGMPEDGVITTVAAGARR